MTTFELKASGLFFIEALHELANYPHQRAFICLKGEDEGYFFDENEHFYSLSKQQEQAFGELTVDITKHQLVYEQNWQVWTAIENKEDELIRIDMGD